MNSQGMDEAIRNHKLILCDRKKLELTGVKDVLAFDEREINLSTQLGKMLIKGEQLHIGKLNLETGEVLVEGRVDLLQYQNKTAQPKRGSIWGSNLFR